MTLVLELNPETARRLEAKASKQGTTPEQMAVEFLENNLSNEMGASQPDFRSAADYVLKKNEELLRRLA